MFRPTAPQRSLFGVETRLDPAKRTRLERSWAHEFRTHALSLIDEDRFARFFHADNGRPNKSVRLIVSVLVLKEIFDLTDADALEQLEWNTAWHYALDVQPDEAHTCQKTLHNFRALLANDEAADLFESTTARLIKAAGLRTGRQRHDSTHIMSNFKLLKRLGLFVAVVAQFLEALRKAHPRLCEQIPEELRGRYLDRDGYFSDARGTEILPRLDATALDVHALVDRFCRHRDVSKMETFVLLARLYEEQCVVSTSDEPIRVTLVEAASATSLQCSSDPDVTYGHKGKGYEVQLTETCGEENAFEVVTAVSVNGANESDHNQLMTTLKQVSRTCGAPPVELHADSGYSSGLNILQARSIGTALQAPMGKSPSAERVTFGDFDFDDDGKQVLRCPKGEIPIEQRPQGTGRAALAIFSLSQCRGCPMRGECPTVTRRTKRVLTYATTDVAVARRRKEQSTKVFKERHKIRSGIEATNSELKRAHSFGKLRVRGRSAVAIAVRLKVLALNFKRLVSRMVAPAPKLVLAA